MPLLLFLLFFQLHSGHSDSVPLLTGNRLQLGTGDLTQQVWQVWLMLINWDAPLIYNERISEFSTIHETDSTASHQQKGKRKKKKAESLESFTVILIWMKLKELHTKCRYHRMLHFCLYNWFHHVLLVPWSNVILLIL